ncbi:MAG: type I glyceraldehyde-3-phosphate dehydrogenase [Chlamydiae bacterium RIFCSPHIGHO2_12_FULL_49_11]|nr:MAG: type I glyceraldehyde-3-phosphate dehydrogenase [Chlamydiae bacterium RIFCSPHIGHO2_12_FULL_49_11]
MVKRIAINGFGRIGRIAYRILAADPNFDVLLINDLVQPQAMAYLLQNDSVYGRWAKTAYAEGNFLYAGEKRVQLFSETDPKNIPYREFGIDCVIESSGVFTTLEGARAHIAAGANRVVISAPSKDAPMFVMGVNDHLIDPENHDVISNASCTTNCLAPLAKVLLENFGIVEGLMTTIHAATASQSVVDRAAKKDLRSGRAVLNNIIPASTGAAKAVAKVLPALEGKLTGMAFRVPVLDVSCVDFTVRLEKQTNLKEIANVIKEASKTSLAGIIGFTEEAVVSSDFIGCPLSSIFDINASMELNPNFFKLIAWYDNEWGYVMRLVDLVRRVA